MTVRVYSLPDCRACKRVKDKLDEAGVEYESWDISKHQQAYDEVITLGAQSVPVVTADGHKPIFGYDPDKLKKLISEL